MLCGQTFEWKVVLTFTVRVNSALVAGECRLLWHCRLNSPLSDVR